MKKQRVNCSDCNQSFRKKSELTRHYQSKHQGLKWQCVDCGRIYKSRDNLKRHCRKRHSSVESTGTVRQIEGQSPDFDLPGRVATCTVIPESEESIPELEPESPEEDNSPVEFVAKQQERFRQAYQITRDRLKVDGSEEEVLLRSGSTCQTISCWKFSMVLLSATVPEEIEKVEFCLRGAIQSCQTVVRPQVRYPKKSA